MNEGSSSELDELLGAYALDAVDPVEAALVEDYLASNPRAAAEVQEHREVATLLAFSGASAPDGVWDKIAGQLDGADEVAPLLNPVDLELPIRSGRASVTSIEPAATPSATAPAPSSGGQVVPFRRRRVGTFLMGAAAAAVVAIGAVVVLDGRASAPADPIAEAYAVALGADTSRSTELVAEGSDVSATGVLGPDGQGFVDASALPTLAESQTYQLWGVLSDTGDVVSIGILGADPAISTFTIDDGIGVDALAITIEDAPGVISDGNPDGAYVGAFA